MKRITILLLLIIFVCNAGMSQSYNLASGIRFGTGIGFSFKYQPVNKMTIEAILSSPLNRDELQLTALVASHNSLITKGFNFYIGGGVKQIWQMDKESELSDPFAVAAVVGAEFSIARLNISYDLNPSFDLTGEGDFDIETGLSIRYILDKRKMFEQKGKGKEKKKKARIKRKKQKQKAKAKEKKRKGASSDRKWWKFW